MSPVYNENSLYDKEVRNGVFIYRVLESRTSKKLNFGRNQALIKSRLLTPLTTELHLASLFEKLHSLYTQGSLRFQSVFGVKVQIEYINKVIFSKLYDHGAPLYDTVFIPWPMSPWFRLNVYMSHIIWPIRVYDPVLSRINYFKNWG